MLLMYIGPDSFLPLGSALAAIVGFILMFWARVKAFVSRMVQPFRKRRASARRDGTGE
jgi:hypothetical protein